MKNLIQHFQTLDIFKKKKYGYILPIFYCKILRTTNVLFTYKKDRNKVDCVWDYF